MACSRFPVKQWITQGGRRSTNLWKLSELQQNFNSFFAGVWIVSCVFVIVSQISTFWPPCKDANHIRIMLTRMVVMMTIVIMTKTTFQGCQPSPGEHHVHVGTGVFPIHKPIAPGRRQRLEITEDFKSHWVQYFIFTKVAVIFEESRATCFSKTSIWTSGGEKLRLKSRPHSPMATHSAHLVILFSSPLGLSSSFSLSVYWVYHHVFLYHVLVKYDCSHLAASFNSL